MAASHTSNSIKAKGEEKVRACDGVRQQAYGVNYSILSSSQFIEQIIFKKKRVEHFAVATLFCDLIEVPACKESEQQTAAGVGAQL